MRPDGLRVEELLDDAMAWLASRYSIQLARLTQPARDGLVSGYREVLSRMTLSEINRAREFTEGPAAPAYPPDAAEFQRRGQRADAAEQFHAAARAAGCNPPAWQSLESRTYAAAIDMSAAGFNLREACYGSPGVRQAWEKAYGAACRYEDRGEVLPQPPALAGALPQKTNKAAFESARGGLWAAIGLTPPEKN